MAVFAISGGFPLTTEDGSLFHTTVDSGGTKGFYKNIVQKYFGNLLKWTGTFLCNCCIEKCGKVLLNLNYDFAMP